METSGRIHPKDTDNKSFDIKSNFEEQRDQNGSEEYSTSYTDFIQIVHI